MEFRRQVRSGARSGTVERGRIGGVLPPQGTLERWRGEVHTALSAGQSLQGAAARATDKKGIRELEGFAQGEGVGRDGGPVGAVPKVRSVVGRRRGLLIALPQRQELVADIEFPKNAFYVFRRDQKKVFLRISKYAPSIQTSYIPFWRPPPRSTVTRRHSSR